jgi:hypothetical protein
MPNKTTEDYLYTETLIEQFSAIRISLEKIEQHLDTLTKEAKNGNRD